MTYEIDDTFTVDNINERLFGLLRQLDFSILTDPSDYSKIVFSMSSNTYTLYNTVNDLNMFLQYSISTDSTLPDTKIVMTVEEV